MVPPAELHIKRDITMLIASNPTLCLEEPRSKKPKIFEKSCLKNTAEQLPKCNKRVCFAEDPQTVYFRKMDSSRSLLNDGHDPEIEEYNPNNLDSGSDLTDIPPPLPEKRILKRSVSHCDLDAYWGDELDSKLTKMDLGKVAS
ncbi:hypothetical protein INT43_003870 [Umbelopsis isabellina]|uniref:Uncharacterized protein n=1 Tax=Mortierella isabellina TaxID=91625 RepID=A0A8H7UHI8_MORIS|nr:hypothetical protein INT43_003870 [Umbelopsis isabellina]